MLRNKFIAGFLLLLCGLFCAPFGARADSQRLSVSPTLFEMAAAPGQDWQSTIRVVNANPYELTVYVDVVNFVPRGEAGDGTLVPILGGETDGSTAAEWITPENKTVVIPPEQSRDVPFSVRIPNDAPPGGHFAAFTVSTRPPVREDGVAQVRTAQIVTSLFFLRVAGDVNESGGIREFSTAQKLYQQPDVELYVRFENRGNVHLRPQGDIRITNMWGQERGIIPINQQSQFGNVLPNSIRRFNFSWRGEWSLSDMGRYTAVVTLAYGTDARNFVSSKTYFWVIPLVPLTVGVVLLASVIALAVFLVRRYIRRVLMEAGMAPAVRQRVVLMDGAKDLSLRRGHSAVSDDLSTAGVPIMTRARVQVISAITSATHAVAALWRNPRLRYPLLVLGCVFGLSLIIWYLMGALTPQRSYEVTYHTDGQPTVLTSDEIAYNDTSKVQEFGDDEAQATSSVLVVNSSGVPELGATVARKLEDAGYIIAGIDTELDAKQGRTVIVYSPEATEVAIALSPLLSNALLSALSGESSASTTPITVYVGHDLAGE